MNGGETCCIPRPRYNSDPGNLETGQAVPDVEAGPEQADDPGRDQSPGKLDERRGGLIKPSSGQLSPEHARIDFSWCERGKVDTALWGRRRGVV